MLADALAAGIERELCRATLDAPDASRDARRRRATSSSAAAPAASARRRPRPSSRSKARRRGRNAVVVTIDPAKRLADALGLEQLSDTPSEIDRRRWDPDGDAPRAGRLSAMMLDTEVDVRRAGRAQRATTRSRSHASSTTASTATSPARSAGTQEYMAMEKLHELHEDGGFDLIVVDTPPTRHALDFLDAPQPPHAPARQPHLPAC